MVRYRLIKTITQLQHTAAKRSFTQNSLFTFFQESVSLSKKWFIMNLKKIEVSGGTFFTCEKFLQTSSKTRLQA